MSITRRHLLQVAVGSLAAVAASACKKKLPDTCTDVTGLDTQAAAARATLGYRDQTPFPDKTCDGCQQFVAAKADGACGSCKVLKGPVHPLGYCKSFSAKS